MYDAHFSAAQQLRAVAEHDRVNTVAGRFKHISDSRLFALRDVAGNVFVQPTRRFGDELNVHIALNK
jgi:hypothetical protein